VNIFFKLISKNSIVLKIEIKHASPFQVSQISYSLVVILELSDVLEVQYKEIMMSSINKNN